MTEGREGSREQLLAPGQPREPEEPGLLLTLPPSHASFPLGLPLPSLLLLLKLPCAPRLELKGRPGGWRS